MALLYVVSFLDRVNVGFAALTMNKDLGFSPEVYGFGAGIFFFGYFLFEVPSNIILEKVGARLWICRIMLTWGVVSMATAFVQGALSFYVLRFLLGLAEAGILSRHGALSDLLVSVGDACAFHRAVSRRGAAGQRRRRPGVRFHSRRSTAHLGLHGWQWLFLLEGLPSVLLGLARALAWMPDRPSTARG